LYRIDDRAIITEAILDVVMSLPGSSLNAFIGATVRCPHSVRDQRGARVAALRPSVVAAEGDIYKLTRYGGEVTPLAYGAYGRLGVKRQRLL